MENERRGGGTEAIGAGQAAKYMFLHTCCVHIHLLSWRQTVGCIGEELEKKGSGVCVCRRERTRERERVREGGLFQSCQALPASRGRTKGSVLVQEAQLMADAAIWGVFWRLRLRLTYQPPRLIHTSAEAGGRVTVCAGKKNAKGALPSA